MSEKEESKVKKVNFDKGKITEVKQPEVVYKYTCPRCGSHIFTDIVVSVAKFSGSGIGYSKVNVCRVCNFISEVKF